MSSGLRNLVWAAGALSACILVACSGSAPATRPAAAASAQAVARACSTGAWFCEGFDSASLAAWDVLPAGGKPTVGKADGKLSFKNEAGNSYLMYEAGESKGVVAAISDGAFAAVSERKTADYFVEARIKPINNKTNNKFVCLLGRYQDVNNWYGACLNVQNSASAKVEFHKANAGKWLRARQFSARTILNDQWYKLRLEMKGSTLSFYIDDDLAGTFEDSSIKAAGKIGFWLDNRSFAVDDVKVGDANVKPVMLSLDDESDWNTEVGGDDRLLTVAATRPDSSADSFSVVSSDPRIVSVKQQGSKIVLHALSAGKATVTVTSGSNPAKMKTVDAVVEPAFSMAAVSYGKLEKRTDPAAGSRAAYADGELALSFDAAPVLANEGSVRIFRSKDDQLVDVIRPKAEVNSFGPSADGYYRNVKMPMMRVAGNKLIVRPHAGKLEYNTGYYVAVSDNLLKDAKLAGKAFAGLGKQAGWRFTTRKAPAATLSKIVVDDDGSKADFRSLQGALQHAMQLPKEAPVSISLKNGTYEELLFLRGKDNVTIKGESRDGTVIQFDNYEALNSGLSTGLNKADNFSRGGRNVFTAANADMLVLERLTLKNSHVKRNGINNQAETIYFAGDKQRLIARDVNFISRQDTLQLNAYSWFYNCLVAGDVDFIWGSSKAALFENSEIRTVVDSTDASKGGYILQARVDKATDKGYVFLNSRLTREEGVPDAATVLARSGGSPKYFDNVVFVNTRMDKHISPAGWWTKPIPNPAKADGQSGWREFGSKALDGSALSLEQRVSAARAMSEAETTAYSSRKAVFADIAWDPQP